MTSQNTSSGFGHSVVISSSTSNTFLTLYASYQLKKIHQSHQAVLAA